MSTTPGWWGWKLCLDHCWITMTVGLAVKCHSILTLTKYIRRVAYSTPQTLMDGTRKKIFQRIFLSSDDFIDFLYKSWDSLPQSKTPKRKGGETWRRLLQHSKLWTCGEKGTPTVTDITSVHFPLVFEHVHLEEWGPEEKRHDENLRLVFEQFLEMVCSESNRVHSFGWGSWNGHVK